jgi:hypothetical protein
MERYFENDQSQCSNKCIVGELGRARIAICELIEGHSGEHERVPTLRLAGVKDFHLPWYFKFS